MDEFEKSLMAKSDQINAADLMSGPMTIKISGLTIKNSEQQKWSMLLDGIKQPDGKDKFFRPCLGMRRLIADIWGTPEKYAGQSITIFRDPDVPWGGEAAGGIRISHMTGMTSERVVSVRTSRTKQKAYTIKPLKVEQAPQPPENALALAQEAARGGVDVFRAWYASDQGKLCRPVAQANMEQLKAMASEADAGGDEDGPPM